MPVFNTILILVVAASIVVCLITWNRIFAYNSKYHLPESTFTRLFHVFTKEHIAIIYTIMVLLHAFITIWFLWTL